MTIKKVSRSAIQTRKACEMKRYLTYEYRHGGVQPIDFQEKGGKIGLGALPKVRGAMFHHLSMMIVEGAERKEWLPVLEEQAKVLPDAIRETQVALIRRAMMGWEIVRGPIWRADFDVISTEQAWNWHITNTIVEPLRMDKILRRKEDRMLGVFDYKTMSTVDPNWIQRMENSDQTHLYVQALKERSDEWVLGICYDGVVIGTVYKGVQKSPFVTGYLKNNKVSPKWSAGSETLSLAGYPDEKWLDWALKAEILPDLYTTTGFLNPPPALLLHTKRSVGRAEEEWAERMELVEGIRESKGEDSPEYETIKSLIEKNPDQCLKYGLDYACPFVDHCWRGTVLDDDFIKRVDHHKEEGDE